MASATGITVDKLSRLIGTAKCPVLLDVRSEEPRRQAVRLVPGSTRREASQAATWARAFSGRSAVVICEAGGAASQGVAAWLRHAGASAEVLEGGYAAWTDARLPTVPEDKLPPRDAEGRTV